ncbi:hypothetical protein KSP39_PZI010114 [Platanthera zijinensis]|uniref:Uncharacterized protein n=1 Tax=Platanthera zijinensis TaxID=2320716 RepID=A0AAP0G742_9ASPA
MELLLELPAEALVFRYSATIAGYLGTCLAIFVAGVGVWRIRHFGSASRSTSVSNSPSPAVSPVISTPSPASSPILPGMAMTECGDGGSLTKGRFTAYYIAEEENGGEECERGRNGVSASVRCFDLFNWERKGDLGWYSYQDRTSINGSVVRLWDDGRRSFGVAQPPTDWVFV